MFSVVRISAWRISSATAKTYATTLASAVSGRAAITAEAQARAVFVHHVWDHQCDLGHEYQVVRLFVPYLLYGISRW
jgi:hypothetical protein